MRRLVPLLISAAAAFVFSLALRGSVPLRQAPSSPVIHALFDLATPASSPFPSNWFTVSDAGNNTGLRTNLPFPDCAVRPSDCQDVAVINTLDGFNINPRLSIPFDGPIDAATVNSSTVFLIRLGPRRIRRTRCQDEPLLRNGSILHAGGDTCGEDINDDSERVIGIDQIVWDPQTEVLHVQSDEFLDQHTRYALIVTRGIRDTQGRAVEAVEGFKRFRQGVLAGYRDALLEALHAAERAGIPANDVVSASVFTTQSVTATLEKIRDQIKAATPPPADFRVGPSQTATVFPLDGVTSITGNVQNGAAPPAFTNTTLNLPLLQVIPGAVGTFAFGKYTSPDYEVHPGEFMPPVGTRSGTPQRQGANEIYFNLLLPAGPKPAGGWPVAIFGHGNGQDKNLSLNVAATMAAHGIATIAINAPGHGFGPLGTLTVNQTNGRSVAFSAGGRGIDQDGNHTIASNEGFSSAPPAAVLFISEGTRQIVVDFMQLVRVIQVGVDVDGDGIPELNPSRIYYFSHSLGSNYGAVFLAIEPDVHVAAFASFGSSVIDNRRLSPGARPTIGQLLSLRVPSLINTLGITAIGGVPTAQPRFNENYPLRERVPFRVQLADGTPTEIQSPVIDNVSGAAAIRDVLENIRWAGRAGDPTGYARYLRTAPLAGGPAKSLIFQFSKGDQTVPNPNATAMLRAGDLADRTTFYRHDVAYAENPALPKDPHAFMVSTGVPAFRVISLAAQEQIATFFATDGAMVIQPLPVRFFQVPIAVPLPEDLNFIP